MVLVATSLAARQWELTLAPEGASAWLTPPLTSFGPWSLELWTSESFDRRTPLAPHQSRALWRKIVSASEEGATLLGVEGAAEWAAAAWSALHHALVEPAKLRATGDEEDYRAFLRWANRYAATLRERDWIDAAGVAAALPHAPLRSLPRTVVVADVLEPSRAERALLERLAASGTEVTEVAAPRPQRGQRFRAAFPDAETELRAAVGWAAAKLANAPQQRIALVIPGLRQRRAELERALEAAQRAAGTPLELWLDGASLAADPVLGAAMTALELVAGSATFATFGSWLRSPFFVADEAERAARALLDVQLRGDVRAQLPFREAYRDGFADVIRRTAPATADALDAALRVVTTTTATPSTWIKLWQRVLQQLGWLPGEPMHPRVQAWQSALAAFGQLTPIVGQVSARNALLDLERLLGERGIAAPLPRHGIHALASIEDVGPGYDAAWIAGFTDRFWPPPARGNPLLPRALQRSAGLPGCTPADARARAARRFAALTERVGDLVCSWPQQMHDFPAEPSPALQALSDAEPAHLRAWLANQPGPQRRRARETLRDSAPPVAPGELRGGTGLLNSQARCPIRAFCEYRLGARALEPLAIGLSARLTGILVHRALQLWLEPATRGEPAAPVQAAVDRALEESFLSQRGTLGALANLERERLARLLTDLAALEARRGGFSVAAVEERRELSVGEWRLSVRIDRLDRLDDGSTAIIDYKTGESASAADWGRERLADTQVPLYAAFAGEPVAATVIGHVRASNVGYSGYSPSQAFPGRAARPPAGRSLDEQLAVWREQITTLVSEIVNGDTRLFADDADLALAEYAPLTRAVEQLALLRGAAKPW